MLDTDLAKKYPSPPSKYFVFMVLCSRRLYIYVGTCLRLPSYWGNFDAQQPKGSARSAVSQLQLGNSNGQFRSSGLKILILKWENYGCVASAENRKSYAPK